MKRQNFIIGAAGFVALATGIGWQRWRGDRSGDRNGNRSADPAADAALPWSLRFPTPDGGELVLRKLRGRPLVLNFWATWCPPCIKEMPELDRFHRAFSGRGWQVVGLAVDQLAPVKDFLRRQPVGFAVGMAGFAGTDLSRQLGNDRGSLPFTIVFDATGRVVQRKLGETSFDELAGWARQL